MNIDAVGHSKGLALPFWKRRQRDVEAGGTAQQRLPGLDWVPDAARNHFIAMSGEFVGTFLFLFFGLSGTQVANTTPATTGGSTATQGANTSQLLYISLTFGFSLAVNAWVFFRISGGLFNPAVTLGMCAVGALPWLRGLLLFIAQIIGAISASAVVLCLFPGPLNVQTTLSGGTSISQGLFIEMFLTAELVFTIFMLAAEKHRGTFIAPVGIGLALFVAELTGVYFTGGSLNPARSFGPAVAAHKFPKYHWIYWVGPVLGSLLAAGFYKFIKILEYETANPGQDEEDERFVPDPDAQPESVRHPRQHDSESQGDFYKHESSPSSRLHSSSAHYADRSRRSSAMALDEKTSPTGQQPQSRGSNTARLEPDDAVHQHGHAPPHQARGSQQPPQAQQPGQAADYGRNRGSGMEHLPASATTLDPSADTGATVVDQPASHAPVRNPGRYDYDDRGKPVPANYLPPGVPSAPRLERRSAGDRRSYNSDKALPFPPSVGRV